jgi:hypothetical protein
MLETEKPKSFSASGFHHLLQKYGIGISFSKHNIGKHISQYKKTHIKNATILN